MSFTISLSNFAESMNLLLHPPTCQCQLTHCIGCCWQKLLPVAYASSAMCFPIADVGQIFEVTDAVADLFVRVSVVLFEN